MSYWYWKVGGLLQGNGWVEKGDKPTALAQGTVINHTVLSLW
jgi:hypothetical protein